MPENGSYVTRAELSAHLTPMREDITEIKKDVKTMLTAQAGWRGAADARRFGTTVVASSLSALVTIGVVLFAR